jgi:predicted secreted protein
MAGESIGWGAEFWLTNDAGSPVLTELAGVTGITVPNPQADDVEITHFKSAGKTREYIQGLIEAGEGTFEMNYVPGSATDVLCRAAQAAGTPRPYKIIIPDAAGVDEWQITGSCYAKGYERNIPIDDRMMATLTVKFSGLASEAAA